MRSWIPFFFLVWAVTAWAEDGTNDWPMLAHDSARSGATRQELRPPFARKWYRLFAAEGLMSGVQPVIAGGKVFLGTLHGTFHALDADTGIDLWTFQAGGAILHTAACSEGKVVFGCADGAIYALNAADGKRAWEVQTGAAVWNAPATHAGVLYAGSRDQQLYAIDLATGNVKWTATTGGPLLGSPALDAKLGRIYIGSEDMHVYAFDLKDGKQLWQSEKLPGVSLRGYHPVIAPDGAVLVTSAPGVSVNTFQALLMDMAKQVFGDFSSWRHSKEANDVVREENFALMQRPETYPSQLEYIRKRLTDQPALQTFFVLDPATGQQRFVVPIVYSESMNGPGAPAVVSAEGKVIVKFQALLRSRYEHYSPFLNVGQLDTVTGGIKPVMDQTRTYGWFDSLLLVHDEQSQLCLSSNILINTHQDSVCGLDLGTLEGFSEPFCRNVHEPKPGEAIAIWARLLRKQPLPQGKEWLARGTAVYGGGSVLDTAISIAGDSFYYLPTHELNAGAAVIAYRMNPEGDASKETTLAPEVLTPEEMAQVQELPWDWDTLEFKRLNHVLEALPGKVAGTRQLPLLNQAAKVVGTIPDSDLDRIVWELPEKSSTPKKGVYTAGLKGDLGEAIQELISKEWQPLLFPSGKFPEESYRIFSEPSETLYTLALAFRHLSPALQERVQAYVTGLCAPSGPLSEPLGQRTYLSAVGEIRAAYDAPPLKLLSIQQDVLRSDVARLYPLWLWAYVAEDWTKVERDWPKLVDLVEQRPNKMEDDCRNGHLAGLIAYCRLADHAGDAKAREAGLNAVRRVMRDRLEFELAHTRGGLIWPVPKMRASFSRWHFMTPEVGRLLGEHASTIHRDLMERYVNYHRPLWWLAWNVETMMRNECPYEFPSVAADVFAARCLVLNEPAEKLAPFIDRPWCHADLYYIQKLALTLDAAGPRQWVKVQKTNAP